MHSYLDDKLIYVETEKDATCVIPQLFGLAALRYVDIPTILAQITNSFKSIKPRKVKGGQQKYIFFLVIVLSISTFHTKDTL